MSAVEKFPILLSDAEEESSAVAPCFSHEGINVCNCVSDLWLRRRTCIYPPPFPATRCVYYLPHQPCAHTQKGTQNLGGQLLRIQPCLVPLHPSQQPLHSCPD